VVQRSVIINPDEGMETAADYLWWSDRCRS
jgi:hypothetical protein